MGIRDRFARARKRWGWFDHLARAGTHYKTLNGDHMAAAVTYFSFLALFPIILVGFAALGLVLQGNHGLLNDIQDQVTKSAPAGLGGPDGILTKAMSSAADHWKAVGIIGLLGALYAGLGWIGQLRTAIQSIWEYEIAKENFVVAKLRDLSALVGLGLAILFSLAVTAAGTGGTHELVKLAGVQNLTGMGTITWIIGIVIAILADTVIFGWMFVRLPRSPLTMRAVFRGSLFAAVGFEILKIVGTYYIAQVGKSPAAGVFGSVIGLLVFVNLVSRFLLFATAWTATSPSLHELRRNLNAAQTDTEPAPSQAVPQRAVREPAAPNGAAIAAGLVAAGMISGATLARVGGRRHSART